MCACLLVCNCINHAVGKESVHTVTFEVGGGDLKSCSPHGYPLNYRVCVGMRLNLQEKSAHLNTCLYMRMCKHPPA